MEPCTKIPKSLDSAEGTSETKKRQSTQPKELAAGAFAFIICSGAVKPSKGRRVARPLCAILGV